MAITAPTPPTPPTAPVVPGARSSTSDGGGTDTTQQNSSTTGAGGDKGIHINISLPDKDSSQQERANVGDAANADNTGKMGTTRKTTGTQDKSQSAQQNGGDDAADKTAQQARQDMVQQALGNDEASPQEQQEVSQQPRPLPGNGLGSMSYMPFLIVFVAAFITFMLKNMSKKPAKPTRRMIARKAKEGHIMSEANSSEGHIDINDSTVAKAASDKDSKKGSHFEMRI